MSINEKLAKTQLNFFKDFKSLLKKHKAAVYPVNENYGLGIISFNIDGNIFNVNANFLVEEKEPDYER